ncbi:MAG: glycosyltransferase [Gemmatimonadetes bacterium]|nr:glycosyltransferase [Gemmatimonadota bacterium]
MLHLDAGRAWRGGQRQVLLLARGLSERGIRSLLAAPSGSPLALRAQAAGLEVAPLRTLGDLDLAAVFRLARLVRRIRPELIHAHDARSHTTAMLAALLGRERPLVVTRRTPFGRRWSPFTRLKYGRGVDLYIAVSQAVRAGLLARGVDPARIRVVYSGIEPIAGIQPIDWRARLGLAADARVVGSVGGLSREKGYGELVDGVAWLDDARVHLVLVGSGRERRRLLARARARGLNGRVHLPGPTQHPRDAMAGFDLYVQPSRHEGLGTSVLDALALGMPTVAASSGGLREIIEPETSGLLVPSGSPGALAGAIARLLEDDALRRTLVEGGRRRAADFSAEAMVEGTMAVYRELVGRL